MSKTKTVEIPSKDDNVSIEETTDGKVRTVTVKVAHTDAGQEWHNRDALVKLEKESNSRWEALDTEERQAMALIITDILRRLVEDPEIWMPTSLVPRTGNYLDIWIGFNMDEIDTQVIFLRVEAERQLLKTKNDLRELDRELADKITAQNA